MQSNVYPYDRAQPQEIIDMEIRAGIEPIFTANDLGRLAKIGFFGEYGVAGGNRKLIDTKKYAEVKKVFEGILQTHST